MENSWISTQEAAEYLNYSVKTITRLCRSGSLDHARVGKRGDYRFKKEWLDDFMTLQSIRPIAKARVTPSVQSWQRSKSLSAALAKRQKSVS